MGGGPGRMGGGPGHMGGDSARATPPGHESEAAAEEAMVKKMRKILTEAQFAEWDRMRLDAVWRRLPDDDGRTPEHPKQNYPG